MTRFLDALLREYETGAISRRGLLQALTLVAVPRGLGGLDDPGPRSAIPSRRAVLRGVNLNHVNLQVSDVERSEAFYRNLFDMPPKREIPGRPYALDFQDGSFLSIPGSTEPGIIEHFCVGVEDFEPERVAAALGEAGLDQGLLIRPDSVYVSDPDGIRVQISTPDWTG